MVKDKWQRVEKLFKIIFELFLSFVNSKVHRLLFTQVSRACSCHIGVIILFVKNFYIPTDSPACWASEYGLFYFYGQIILIAEDNANAEGDVVYRCHTQVLKQDCLFRPETQCFFLSNDPLADKKIRWKNPQYQFDNNWRLISIKIKRYEFNSYRLMMTLMMSYTLMKSD